MRMVFRASPSFMRELRADLVRPHRFADERVGFIAVRAAQGLQNLVLIAESYHPADDADYLPDPNVGAMLGSEAIRKALEIALLRPVGMLHVHMHFHSGRPRFSGLDMREFPKFVPDFFKVRKNMPHGALVLSKDYASGIVWSSQGRYDEIQEFNYIGESIKTDDINYSQ